MRVHGIALALVLAARSAGADVPRCASGDADLQYQDIAFDELSGDTGWFPSGSPAQLRLVGHIAGMTTVAMSVSPTACWDGAMAATVHGHAGGGTLDFAYGADLHAYAQIHTTILGNPIDWSGEIPLPTDFLLDHTSTFDPTLLPGAAIDHVSGSDVTSPLTLLSTDLIGQYIDIVGISGGLHLDAIGGLTTTYRTTRVTLGSGAIDSEGGNLAIAPPPGGFGAALDVAIAADGVVSYAPAITFNVGFNVKIFYVPVVDFTLFGVTLPLDQIDVQAALSGTTVHLPLPKAPPLAGARVDFAAGATQSLAIRDVGEAPLVIEPASLPEGVTAARLVVAPGDQGALVLVAADGAVAAGPADAVFATNDPAQPSVAITVGRDVGGTALPGGDASHAGCAAGGGSGVPPALVLGLLLASRSRRGRCGRRVPAG